MIIRFLMAAATAALVVMPALAAAPLDVAERTRLQAEMRQTIEDRLVDGHYLYLDPKKADVVALYPAKSHPMILSLDNYYVLCTDFLTDDGQPVNVDFYVARRDNDYVVFDTVIDNRGPLDTLMQSGRASIVE